MSNAYLIDVWTHSAYRRQGIATAMLRALMARVPGQHIGLQTDHGKELYTSLGFQPQPEFMSIVVGSWLDNDANQRRARSRPDHDAVTVWASDDPGRSVARMPCHQRALRDTGRAHHVALRRAQL